MAYDVLLAGRRATIYNDVGPVRYGNIYLPNVTSYAKIVRYTKSNDYGSATGNIAGDPIPAPATDETQYYVRLHLNDGSHEDIILGSIPSQPNWTNDEAGYQKSVEDMSAAAV